MDLQIIIFAPAGLPGKCSRALILPHAKRAGMLTDCSWNALKMLGSIPRAAPQGEKKIICRSTGSVEISLYKGYGSPKYCLTPREQHREGLTGPIFIHINAPWALLAEPLPLKRPQAKLIWIKFAAGGLGDRPGNSEVSAVRTVELLSRGTN